MKLDSVTFEQARREAAERDEKLKRLMSFANGLDELHGRKLSRIAAAFAVLETELEEILPEGSASMVAVSKMLEVASMVAGAAVASGESR